MNFFLRYYMELYLEGVETKHYLNYLSKQEKKGYGGEWGV